jgi:hypothetical protein
MRKRTASPATEPSRHPDEAERQFTQPSSNPNDDERHLTQLDLARRWRLSTRTLERWRWLRYGPAYLRLGKVVVYRLEDVEAFEAAQRRVAR